MIGAIISSAIGILGAAFGVYYSIRKAKGPEEHALVITYSIFCCMFVAAYLVCLQLVPGWYDILLVIPYVVVLIFIIRRYNRKLAQIREEKSHESLD